MYRDGSEKFQDVFISVQNGIVSYTWINDNTDIGLITFGVGSIESFVAENTTNEIITANLIVTPTYSNDGVLCLGNNQFR